MFLNSNDTENSNVRLQSRVRFRLFLFSGFNNVANQGSLFTKFQLLIILLLLISPVHGQKIGFQFLGSFGRQGSGDGEFNNPQGISIDLTGNIYVVDTGNHRIQKFDNRGNFILQRGGFGWEDNQFEEPVDICASTGLDVFVVDRNGAKISRFDKDLNFISSLRTDSDGLEENAFLFPVSITLSQQGDLFIIDGENNKIIKMNFLGKIDFNFGAFDIARDYLKTPVKITINRNNLLFISDKTLGEILIFDYFGNFLRKIGKDVLIAPAGICCDEKNRLFVADSEKKTVFLFDIEGNLLYFLNGKNVAGAPLPGEPFDISYYDKTLYVLDRSKNTILLFREID